MLMKSKPQDIKFIYAQSGDCDFIQQIECADFSGNIHSIFERVVNIQCIKTGDLYCLANKNIDNAPNTLVLDIVSFRNLDITIENKVATKNQILYINDKIAITVEHAIKWESILPVYPANLSILSTNLPALKNTLPFMENVAV